MKIAGFFFFGQTTKIFKNAHNYCGTFVAFFIKKKKCHDLHGKTLIINL